jgi:hypothetical protein
LTALGGAAPPSPLSNIAGRPIKKGQSAYLLLQLCFYCRIFRQHLYAIFLLFEGFSLRLHNIRLRRILRDYFALFFPLMLPLYGKKIIAPRRRYFSRRYSAYSERFGAR